MKIETIIGIMFFSIMSGILLLMVYILYDGIKDFFKNMPKYKTHYIDINNNEGIAKFCDKNMTCVVDDHRILVKEYWEVEI